MKPADPPPLPSDEVDLRALGSRIVELRSARGWKQVELGRRAGIEPPRLSRIENGRAAPTLPELVRLRNAFGAGLDQMVFGDPAAGTLRRLAAELSPEAPGGVETLERLLHYVVRGFQAEHGG
ncbi:MAG TPA: helix-turn-helix transcriptional regulator [Thermoanaerobaculia bacterium]|nr:helix-turn-helix transcriptional regulator [Thermoanaerobaculia bacterium]